MVKTSSSLLVLLASLPLAVLASGFNAEVDRHQLAPNESLTLTLSLKNADLRLRAEGLEPNIDLSPLHQDFDVGVPKSNFRYNIYQGRGRSSSEIKVILHPKRPGNTTIPAFEINGQATQPIKLQIVDNATNNQAPDIFVQAGTTHQGPLWVGQQLVVYLDVFHRIELDEAKLSDILETEPTRIELLPHWPLPQHKTQQHHQGYDYQVQRMSWALFPQDAGTLKVYLPSTHITSSNKNELNFSHQQLSFDVKALPENLPADIIIGRPEIRLEPLPSNIKQHQLNHWTITIDAPTEVSGLPKFLPTPPLATTLQSYPDKAIRDTLKTHLGISDQASYSHSIIASQAGAFEVPQQLIPYFDPNNGELAYVTIPAQAFVVKSGPVLVNERSLLAETPNVPSQTLGLTSWHWMTALLALSNLLTLGLLLKRRTNPRPTTQQNQPTSSTTNYKHSPIATLLHETNADSLEALLHRWKTLPNSSLRDEVSELTKQLQALVYGNNEIIEKERIKELCIEIGEKAKSILATEIHQDKQDKWLPEATLR